MTEPTMREHWIVYEHTNERSDPVFFFDKTEAAEYLSEMLGDELPTRAIHIAGDGVMTDAFDDLLCIACDNWFRSNGVVDEIPEHFEAASNYSDWYDHAVAEEEYAAIPYDRTY